MIYNLNLIKQWFIDTGIIEATTIEKQFIKLTEELGEIAEEIQLEYFDKVALGKEIGDYIVVMTGICLLSKVSPVHLDINCSGHKDKLDCFTSLVIRNGLLAEAIAKNKDIGLVIVEVGMIIDSLCKTVGIDKNECARLAYQKISKRKGKMVNGIFIKESDLK